MTTVADPYIINLPIKITEDDGTPTSEFFDWLVYDNRFKHDLWQQSGGGTNLFDTLQAQITSNDTDIAALDVRVTQNEADIDVLEGLVFVTDVLNQSTNMTTSGSQFIEVTAAITITLNASAADEDSVKVYINYDGAATNVTDGTGTDIIEENQTVISYRFKTSLGWVRGA